MTSIMNIRFFHNLLLSLLLSGLVRTFLLPTAHFASYAFLEDVKIPYIFAMDQHGAESHGYGFPS